MQAVTVHDDRVAMAALLVGGLLAGGNPVGVRFTVLELDALWGAALRFAVASVLLAGVMAALRLRLPSGAALRGAALYGLLNFGGAFAAAYYALSHIQAGLASTLIALVPLATLVLAVAQRRERLRPAALAGGVLALAGVALVSKASLAGSVPPAALVAAIAGVVCMGQAAIVARGLGQTHDVHPVVLNTVGMAVGATVLLAGAVAAGDRIVLPLRPATWLAISYVVVGGSIGVFMLYVVVLRRWEASRAAYLTMLMPPVAVALSSWLDHEPITLGLLFGGGLILAGVYVGALRPMPPAPPASPRTHRYGCGSMRTMMRRIIAAQAVTVPERAEWDHGRLTARFESKIRPRIHWAARRGTGAVQWPINARRRRLSSVVPTTSQMPSAGPRPSIGVAVPMGTAVGDRSLRGAASRHAVGSQNKVGVGMPVVARRSV